MNRPPFAGLARRFANVLAVGVCLSVGLLVWFGYRAIHEWQRSSVLLDDRRTKEAVDLLTTALTRDMQGVQRSVLGSTDRQEIRPDAPYSMVNLVASAFARYPYPESFFAWRDMSARTSPVLFNRRDRPPPWLPGDVSANRFPVVVAYEPPVADALLERIRIDAAGGRPFSVFETRLAGDRYQVVARLLYDDELHQHVEAVFGFLVNLGWAHENYFREVTDQVIRADGAATGLALVVRDHDGNAVGGTPAGTSGRTKSQRLFTASFFDPQLVAAGWPSDLSNTPWAVEVATADDSTLAAAVGGANRMLILAAVAASMLGLGLVLSVRAVRANVELAELRSDFVSGVTHELKTPIATIRAAGETLVAGRVRDPATQRDYARLMVQEARRLTRLVDNLLVMSKVTDAAAGYSVEPLSLDALIMEALQRFRLQLADAGFELTLDVSPELPQILADRTAMVLMLDNLLDNAIRYASSGRKLEIRARAQPQEVRLEIRDHGPGIPEEEIGRVTQKFYRGRNAASASGGTGLGLAIAKRIVSDHGGTLAIHSTVGHGTTVTITLPATAVEHDVRSRALA